MEKIGAKSGLCNYDAKIYIPKIIDYWNNYFYSSQHRFKAFIFGSSGHYRPLFKYGPNDYTIPIILYYIMSIFMEYRKVEIYLVDRIVSNVNQPIIGPLNIIKTVSSI